MTLLPVDTVVFHIVHGLGTVRNDGPTWATVKFRHAEVIVDRSRLSVRPVGGRRWIKVPVWEGDLASGDRPELTRQR